MMRLAFLTAGLVLAIPALALAQDEKVLSGRVEDDLRFADALYHKGYPDLAKRLLEVIKKRPEHAQKAAAAIKAIELYLALDTAKNTDDPLKRIDEMSKVVGDMEKFIDSSKGTADADSMRDNLPEVYSQIGEAYTGAIKKTKDEAAIEELRKRGDQFFLRYEDILKKRIEELAQVEPRTIEIERQHEAAMYNYPHTIYYHSLLYPAGSAQRIQLCTNALTQFDEFDLEYGHDVETHLPLFAYIDTALCLKETGKLKEADDTLATRVLEPLRTGWEVDKSGRLQIDAPDLVDLIAYATLQRALIHRDQKDAAKELEILRDYFATIPNPLQTPSSLLLASAYGDALIATGDSAAAAALGKQMIDEDPNGIMGVKGRELRERSGAASYKERLQTVQARLAANDYDRAVAVAHQVIKDTAGTPDEAKAGSEALLLVGQAFFARRWFDEAALAYQAAFDKYPTAESAPEALVRAIDSYSAAQRGAKRKYYKDRIDAAADTLVKRFPKDQRAIDIVLVKAQGLANENDLVAAAGLYCTVPEGSTNYTKAQLLCGMALFNHAATLAGDKKEVEAKPFYPQAEQAFKTASTAIAKRLTETRDPGVLKALDEQDFLARFSLATLYMVPAFDKGNAADPVIDELETKWGKDPAKGPKIQDLRGRKLIGQNKFDEAEKWVTDLVNRDARAAAGPAGSLARVLDQQGLDKFTANPQSLEGADLWKRAARFYWISITPQVKGTMAQSPSEMTDVGNRFYAYALRFNDVPEKRVSFVDWVPTKKAVDYWAKAAEIYEAALAQTPDYRMTINLGRTYGFLQRWVDAARIYQRLFETEPLVNPKNPRRLDANVMKAKPELVYAYLEWGVAERMAYSVDNDKDRLTRALNTIFSPLLGTVTVDKNPEIYWPAKYHQLRAHVDRGDYKDAQLGVEDVQRSVSVTFDDDKFGYKTLFEAMLEELKTK